MGLKAILHSDLAKTLAHYAANRIIGVDVLDEIIAVTSGGVLPEGLNHDKLVSMAIQGATLMTKEPTQPQGANSVLPKSTDNHAVDKPTATLTGNGFRFGAKSQAELEGVHPDLIKFANRTLMYSTQDFMVYDGLRTMEEQRAYVARGVSKTMQSMHMKQADGFGHAVDLVPVVGTIPKWDWNLIYPVVDAAIKAAFDMGIAENIVWGGAWDRRLSDLTNRHDIKKITEEYAARHPGKDFLDGPHFELRL